MSSGNKLNVELEKYLDQRFGEITKGLDRIESEVKTHGDEIRRVADRSNGHTRDIQELIKKTDNNKNRFTKLDSKIDRVESEAEKKINAKAKFLLRVWIVSLIIGSILWIQESRESVVHILTLIIGTL